MSSPRLFLDLDLATEAGLTVPLDAAQARHLNVLRMRAGDALELVLPGGPWRADLAELGKDRATARLVARQTGIYTQDPIAYAESWTAPTTEGQGYTIHLGLDTVELANLLTGETPSIDLMLELSIESTWTTIKSQTITLHIPRALWRGDELTPTPAIYPAPVVQFIDDVPSSKLDFFMFPNAEAPTTGLFQASDSRYIYTIKGGWSYWRRTPIATW